MNFTELFYLIFLSFYHFFNLIFFLLLWLLRKFANKWNKTMQPFCTHLKKRPLNVQQYWNTIKKLPKNVCFLIYFVCLFLLMFFLFWQYYDILMVFQYVARLRNKKTQLVNENQKLNRTKTKCRRNLKNNWRRLKVLQLLKFARK